MIKKNLKENKRILKNNMYTKMLLVILHRQDHQEIMKSLNKTSSTLSMSMAHIIGKYGYDFVEKTNDKGRGKNLAKYAINYPGIIRFILENKDFMNFQEDQDFKDSIKLTEDDYGNQIIVNELKNYFYYVYEKAHRKLPALFDLFEGFVIGIHQISEYNRVEFSGFSEEEVIFARSFVRCCKNYVKKKIRTPSSFFFEKMHESNLSSIQ